MANQRERGREREKRKERERPGEKERVPVRERETEGEREKERERKRERKRETVPQVSPPAPSWPAEVQQPRGNVRRDSTRTGFRNHGKS